MNKTDELYDLSKLLRFAPATITTIITNSTTISATTTTFTITITTTTTTSTKVAVQRLPDMIVAGVKKCGTGAVIEILKFHKTIAAPAYESSENDLFDDESWASGVPYFISRMPKAFPEQVVITKSQSVLTFPDKKIVYTKLQEIQVNC